MPPHPDDDDAIVGRAKSRRIRPTDQFRSRTFKVVTWKAAADGAPV
jgi:hypothetical protein